MAKRSPRYPRLSLAKALEMTKRLFAGAHQSRVDVDTAAKVIGYSSSTGGAAASAIGALRQFNLVDGLRGDLGVSDLAMRILQPMSETERISALQEAALAPEIFAKIIAHFGGDLPLSDEPIRALLIRQEGFSTNGANELIETLRETVNFVPAPATINEAPPADDGNVGVMPSPTGTKSEGFSASLLQPAGDSELIILPLGSKCKAELRFIGETSPAAYGRLIQHLELLRETLSDDDG